MAGGVGGIVRGLVVGGMVAASVLVGVAPADATGAARTTNAPALVDTEHRVPLVRVATRPPLAVTLPRSPVLTLPGGDGFHDWVRATVAGRSALRVDLLAVAGTTSTVVARRVLLHRSATGYTASIGVPVRLLHPGSWSIRARRSDARTVTAVAPHALRVGSGAVASVVVVPDTRTLYPFRDGYRDTLTASVRALDEVGTVLPAIGTLRLTSGSRSTSTFIGGPSTRLTAAGLPPGPAVLRASMTGPAGTAHRSGPLRMTLKPTAIASVSLATSTATVEPVVDDLADTVSITVGGTTTTGRPIATTGSVTITGGGATVQRWPLPTPAKRTLVWDGRVAGRIVPGTYSVVVSMRGPEGPARTRTTTLTVSSDHLPYRMRTLFLLPKGNQQGLAVHDGTYYVSVDLRDGTSRIDEYDQHGAAMRHLGPFAIGHAAELAYSSVTHRLYAANGGFTDPTSVFGIDPATGAIDQTLDLGSLGPNGMVAADDANNRLVVFAGQPDAYTVSFVDPTSGAVTATSPVTIAGLPQGLEVADGELWIYSSLPDGNRITRFTLGGTATEPSVAPVPGDAGTIELAAPGEGEGMALAPNTGPPTDAAHPLSGLVVLGAHHPNRIAVLEAVPDE